MKMKFIIILFISSMAMNAVAQRGERYEYVQKGEFGITVGAAHYFGDINTRAAINRPKPAMPRMRK